MTEQELSHMRDLAESGMVQFPKLQADLKLPFVFDGNLRYENIPVHKAIREAMVSMVTFAVWQPCCKPSAKSIGGSRV